MNTDEQHRNKHTLDTPPSTVIPLDVPPGGDVVQIPGGSVPLVFERAEDARRFRERLRDALVSFRANTSMDDTESSTPPLGVVKEQWEAFLNLQRARTVAEAERYLEILTGEREARQAAARVHFEQQRAAEEAQRQHFADITRTMRERINALQDLAEDDRESERTAIVEILRREAAACPYEMDAEELHRLWFCVAQTYEERRALWLSWRLLYAVEAERGEAIPIEYERRKYVAEMRAAVVRIDAALDGLDAEIAAAGGGGASTSANIVAPWRLDVPLYTLVRLVEAMRRAGYFRRDLPTADITRRLFVAGSAASDPERNYNAARQKVNTSNAADKHITALILELTHGMPPEQIAQLAEQFNRIVRGDAPRT